MECENRYADFEFEIYANSAGDERAQADETTPVEILTSRIIPARAAPTNEPILLCEAVAVGTGLTIS